MDGFSTVAIRRASPGDKTAAYAIVSEYYEALNVVCRESFEQFGSDYFARGAGFWFALIEQRIVGCIALRELSFPDAAEIKRMYLRPDARGRGIAQALLDAAQSYARDAGYHWLYLDTTAEMAAAARLYERNGFQRCERYNDNVQATIFMRKSLNGS